MNTDKNRPSDIDILTVLADHFRVHESKVQEWILFIDHEALERWIIKEFGA